jgi:glycosyltransferase involved in cell wall biosynthesis
VSEVGGPVSTVSVVIPVKDGERYLEELLDALAREGARQAGPEIEVLVIDSGSRDRTLQIARAAGVHLLEIEPDEFGHGRTRNLGAEHTSGELICFLTQDATPCPGWLDAYREAFALEERVGAAYGPHLPRSDTSPTIARELTEFFAGFEAQPSGEREDGGREDGKREDGHPVIQRPGDPTFLSNVNACYARACWQEIRFRDIAYAEDQAFGADLLDAGWSKVYHPGAAVLHAHDYGAVEFMRRYFDEYRGLRETTGHVEAFGVLAAAREVRSAVVEDRRWVADRDLSRSELTRLTARATLHHGGRRVFSALGSRAARIPGPVSSLLSLEGRAESGDHTGAATTGSPLAAPKHFPQLLPHDDYSVATDVWREGATPLLEPVPGMAERERLRLAMVIPPFARGSGGHNTLFQIFSRLERRGHSCSVWLADHTIKCASSGRPCCATTSTSSSPLSRPRLQGLRAVAGRRRRDRDRLADRPCRPASRSMPRAGLRGQRPRARVLRDLHRARAGRGHLPARPALHRRQPLAAGSPGRPLRRERRRFPARCRAGHLPTAAGRARAPDTVVYYARHSRRGEPCRSG